MSINPETADLINAELDGEISSGDRTRLDAILREDAEARAYRAELGDLCTELDAVEAVEPPPHLKHVILNSIPAQRTQRGFVAGWGDFLRTLSPGNVMRYAMPFAAGVILTVAFVNSDVLSTASPDTLPGLVGTLVDSGQQAHSGTPTTHDDFELMSTEISGSVNLYATDSTLKLDFDLASAGPIEVVTRYPQRDVRFSGFAQLEDSDTSVTADQGAVRVRMAGRQRYVVYLENGAATATSLTVGFYSGDVLIFEDSLEFGGESAH